MALPLSVNGENPYFKILDLKTSELTSLIIASHQKRGISLWKLCDKIVLTEKLDLSGNQGRCKLKEKCFELLDISISANRV